MDPPAAAPPVPAPDAEHEREGGRRRRRTGPDDDAAAADAPAEQAAPARTDFTWKFCPSSEAPFAGLFAWRYLADALGYFEEEGVTQEFVYQTGGAPLAVSGAVDVAFLDVPETLNAFHAGQELKAVFQPAYTLILGVFVPEDSPIQTFNADDLRGQTIGITEFAGGEVPVVRALMGRIGLVEGEDYETPADERSARPAADGGRLRKRQDRALRRWLSRRLRGGTGRQAASRRHAGLPQ